MLKKNYFNFEKDWDLLCVPHLKNEELLKLTRSNLIKLLHHFKKINLLDEVKVGDDLDINLLSSLPPCTSLLENPQNIFTDYFQLEDKLIHQWKKSIDTKTINENWDEFVALFSLEEESIIDVVNLLDKVGYVTFLKTFDKKHTVKELVTYYQENYKKIEWYCVPAGCMIWNDKWSRLLASLIYPEKQWIYKFIYLESTELHLTVCTKEEDLYFDLLHWYEGF